MAERKKTTRAKATKKKAARKKTPRSKRQALQKPAPALRAELLFERKHRKAQPQTSIHKSRAAWFQARASWPRRDPRAGVVATERARVASTLPASAIPGQWIQAGPSNIGGRTTCIAVHPNDASRIWIGSAGGGVWTSPDSGLATWQSVWDQNGDTLNIGSLALDPSNQNTLYCGTGEANLSADSHPGVGIFRSSNGGTSWSLIGDALADQVPSRIGSVAIDPFDPQHIRLGGIGYDPSVDGGTGGLYFSFDGGTNWARETFVSTGNYWCHAVLFDPSTQDRIYATFTANGIQNGIWRSVDGGASWQHLTSGLPFSPQMNRTSLSLCVADPNVIYAQTSDAQGGVLGIHRSADGGNGWTDVAGFHFQQERQMSYNNAIVVSPDDPDLAICGGVDLHRTTDGGATWQQITDWAADRGAAFYAHADHHALAMPESDPEFVYDMNDGGMDVSPDRGCCWENRSSGLPVNMFYDLAVAPTNGGVYGGGAQDNGTIITANDDPADFFEVSGGDGGWIVFDPTNVNHFFTSFQYMGIIRFRGSQVDLVSPPETEAEKSHVWMVYIAMDRNNPNTVFTGSRRVWRTTDDGDSWTAVSGILDFSPITAIEVVRSDSQRVYVATENGGFFRSTDGGDTWSPNLAGATLPGRTITRIATRPTNANQVFVTVANFGSSHVFRSDDGGLTWADVDQGRLPDVPHHAITFRPDQPTTVIAASDAGVYLSPDLGATWQNLSKNLPHTMFVDLVYHETDQNLFAASYGRSIWRLAI